jgi:thioredoxin 1
VKEKLLKILKEDGLTILIVVALVVAYALLRTPGDDFESLAALETEFTDGTTVIEFYSNTCSICLASKPKVDRMERDLAGSAELLRLNVKNGPGRQLASRWGVTGVPTFVVLNDKGEAVYARAGAPDVEAILAAVKAAQP